jgi:uncharacterized membrane protein
MWILFALLSAMLAATRRTGEKQLVLKFHHFTIGWMLQLMALPIIVTLAFINHAFVSPLHLGLNFWVPLLIVCVGFYPLNAFLYLQAIKHSELSKVLPIQSLWPALSLVPAWITLHETPSGLGILGILLTVCGVYTVSMKGFTFHHPFSPFREERSSLYMLLSVILVTLVGILDKIAINATSPIYFSFMSTVGAVIVMYCIMKYNKADTQLSIKSAVSNFGILGTILGASYTTYLIALSLGPVAYVTSIRSTNILMGSILGIIYLKEKFTYTKIASFAFIAAGSILLALN